MLPCVTLAQCSPEPTDAVKGAVLLETLSVPDPAPGAKVTVWGDFTMLSMVADREGKFRFSNIEPGTYTVEADYFGLHAEQTITVEEGVVIQVALLLKPIDRHGSGEPSGDEMATPSGPKQSK